MILAVIITNIILTIAMVIVGVVLLAEMAKDTMKAIVEGQKHGELIHEKLKASAEVLSYGKEK